MGLFDDTERLSNRTFGWGLAPYSPRPEGWEDAESPPEDSSLLALYVDEEGTINAGERIVLYKSDDPIDSDEVPTFSKTNNFVAGLRKAIVPFPVYGILAFPIAKPYDRTETGRVIGQPVYSPGGDMVFPRDTPEGFVPCAGQVLKYPGGKTVVLPNLARATVTGGAGDGATTSVVYFAPAGTAYLIKVEDGWREMVPDLRGTALKDLGNPGTPTMPI
jgi:hypothetical protein